MANVRSSPPGRGAAPGQDGAQAGADEPQNGHRPQQPAGQPNGTLALVNSGELRADHHDCRGAPDTGPEGGPDQRIVRHHS